MPVLNWIYCQKLPFKLNRALPGLHLRPWLHAWFPGDMEKSLFPSYLWFILYSQTAEGNPGWSPLAAYLLFTLLIHPSYCEELPYIPVGLMLTYGMVKLNSFTVLLLASLQQSITLIPPVAPVSFAIPDPWKYILTSELMPHKNCHCKLQPPHEQNTKLYHFLCASCPALLPMNPCCSSGS